MKNCEQKRKKTEFYYYTWVDHKGMKETNALSYVA